MRSGVQGNRRQQGGESDIMTDYRLWVEQNIPDLTGKVTIVTGANSGLGFEATKLLVSRGAHGVLAVRDAAKGVDAARRIRAAVPRADPEVAALDLADLGSIRRCADAFRAGHDRLDLLINNAGVMAIPRRTTADGFEMQFGTNHLGHFALTGLLLPLLLRTPGARIVTVGSGVHILGCVNFDDLQGGGLTNRGRPTDRANWPTCSSCMSCSAAQAGAAGSQVVSVAAHPGYAATNLQAVGPRDDRAGAGREAYVPGQSTLREERPAGALPEVYAAASPEVHGGDYCGRAASWGKAASRSRCIPAVGLMIKPWRAGCGWCRSSLQGSPTGSTLSQRDAGRAQPLVESAMSRSRSVAAWPYELLARIVTSVWGPIASVVGGPATAPGVRAASRRPPAPARPTGPACGPVLPMARSA